ncbi:MAG: hypothetical protein AB7H53_19285 [Hyphomicrobium sp.]
MTPTGEQLAARAQLAAARMEHRDRKRDTRRKVIAGAIVLAHAQHDAEFRRELGRLFQLHVTRSHDRALFSDLLADE